MYHNQSDYHITINNSFGNPINCNYEGYISLYSIISDNIIDMADTVSDLVGSIQVRSGDFTVINGNVLAVATALRQKAIYLYNADQCAVFGNNIYYMLGTTQAGIYSTGNRNVIVGNHIFDIRVGWGIRLAGGNENVIVGNLILNMTGAGAILDGGFGTLVENNNI